ncbi:MAG TPA: SPW repeat protein, partial [Pseudolabrys sp.]|nr:SPW repeat protein [Pseudolabrys sp.]
MPAARFTPPRQWEDWLSWALGLWMLIAPWALRFEFQAAATKACVITGVLLILVEAVTLSAFRAWEEWLNVLLGVWLIAAPWLLGVVSTAAMANFVIVGVIVVFLAGYELWQ